MTLRHRPTLLTLTFLFIFLACLSHAAKPTSFCKCTCGSNSTIIALHPDPPAADQDPIPLYGDQTDYEPPPRKTGTCTDCNRSFCLEKEVNNLPICSETKDEQITTECFQRDSAKDEAVIYAFIILTVGLLGWSLVRPWVRRKAEVAQERRSYVSVPSGQGNG